MDIKAILQRYWGYTKFRPLQEDIIVSVLQGNDTLALLPTGGGKSICFQVPCYGKKGVCIFCYATDSFNERPSRKLASQKIPAAAIYTGMHQRNRNERIIDVLKAK